jgi:phosphoketolase
LPAQHRLINVIVADKQKHLQFTTIDEAIVHCTKGMGIWKRASTDAGEEPDVVLACCGDVPPGGAGGRGHPARAMPDLKLRFVNVVDLFRLQPAPSTPRLDETRLRRPVHHDKPIIFNFHGYPWLIHRLAYKFKNHDNLHVHGYTEKGNINTPLELAILNETSRFTWSSTSSTGCPSWHPGGAPEGGHEAGDHRQLCTTPTSTGADRPRSPTGPGRTEPCASPSGPTTPASS